MSTPPPKDVLRLLAEWREGQPGALDKLWPVVHRELHRLAKRYMRQERSGHTLQTTGLVGEAYLKLVGHQDVRCTNRAQFFALAARVMRCLLVDYARGRNYQKRGGGIEHVPLDEAVLVSQEQSAEVLALDAALKRLEVIDPRKSQIVELRYFGGLDVEEAAEAISVAPITVKREWLRAKAWLHRELSPGASDDA